MQRAGQTETSQVKMEASKEVTPPVVPTSSVIDKENKEKRKKFDPLEYFKLAVFNARANRIRLERQEQAARENLRRVKATSTRGFTFYYTVRDSDGVHPGTWDTESDSETSDSESESEDEVFLHSLLKLENRTKEKNVEGAQLLEPSLVNDLSLLTIRAERIDGAEDLSNGSEHILNYAEQSSNGAELMSNSAELMSKGAELMSNGAEYLSDGAKLILNSTEHLSSGAELILNGADQIINGADEISNSAEHLSANQVSHGAEHVSNGAEQISSGNELTSNGAEHVSNGAEQISNGIELILNGAEQISTRTEPISNGAERTSYGTDLISNGAEIFSNGTELISNGAKHASNGALHIFRSVDHAASCVKMPTNNPQKICQFRRIETISASTQHLHIDYNYSNIPCTNYERNSSDLSELLKCANVVKRNNDFPEIQFAIPASAVNEQNEEPLLNYAEIEELLDSAEKSVTDWTSFDDFIRSFDASLKLEK